MAPVVSDVCKLAKNGERGKLGRGSLLNYLQRSACYKERGNLSSNL